MTFDAGTWWLIGLLLTGLLGVVGALVTRSVFHRIDENSADIKEVRENYTTRKDHKEAVDAVHREIKEVRSEMYTETKSLRVDIKEIKDTCLRKEDFERNFLRLESKMDALNRYIMERRD